MLKEEFGRERERLEKLNKILAKKDLE